MELGKEIMVVNYKIHFCCEYNEGMFKPRSIGALYHIIQRTECSSPVTNWTGA